MMKIGDKVRFLNEVGGGKIVGFQGKDVVLVEDEDGFSIPMIARDIVVIETDDYNVPLKGQSKKKDEERKKEAEAIVVNDMKNATLASFPQQEVKGHDRLNVHLCFIPEDIRQVTTTSFVSYLVNDSNYSIFYTFMNCENGVFTVRSSGLMEPNTKILLEEFDRSVLNSLERVCVQLIAFKAARPFVLQPAVSAEIRIDTVKFYKLHTFVPTDFFPVPALVYDVVLDGETRKQVFVKSGDIKEALLGKVGEDMKPAAPYKPIPKDSIKDILEVDLHIHELLDDVRGLGNADMLNLQLDRFRQVMEENRKKTGKKIVFIHGKGEGVLRKALLSELRVKYPQCKVQDASFQEYGFGATMVTIH